MYFKGGIISYSNEAKSEILGVSESTIEKFGAVSEQTVVEMVKGAINLFKTDFAVAVSGVAGPDGGSAEKPVGTIWIAYGDAKNIDARKYNFGNLREINIRKAASTALFNLLNYVKENLQ